MKYNKLTHELKLHLTNDYDTYKQMIEAIRDKKTLIEQKEVLKYYVDSLLAKLLSEQNFNILNHKNEKPNYRYLFSCIREDLKN